MIFIMATTDAHKVPATILSRAQSYSFKLVGEDVILNHLETVAKKEGIDIDKGALEIIVRRGGGSFRDSLSLLDQISTLSDTKITKEMVEKSLGLPEDSMISELLDLYSSGNVVKITTVLKDLFEYGVRAEIISSELINTIIKNPTAGFLPLLSTLPDVKEPFAEARLLYILTANVPSEPIVKPISAPIEAPKKPEPKSKLSDIMGGEVKEYGGGNPF